MVTFVCVILAVVAYVVIGLCLDDSKPGTRGGGGGDDWSDEAGRWVYHTTHHHGS